MVRLGDLALAVTDVPEICFLTDGLAHHLPLQVVISTDLDQAESFRAQVVVLDEMRDKYGVIL